MDGRLSQPNFANTTEPARAIQVEACVVELLPATAYSVSYTPQKSVLGFSFDQQTGTHAFASDKRTDFVAAANTWAFVPAGCDVFSESEQGGEYLKITLSEQLASSLYTTDPARKLMDKSLVYKIRDLRRALISGDLPEPLLLDKVVTDIVGQCINKTDVSKLAQLTDQELKLLDDFIDANLDQPLSVAILADLLGLSAGYFTRSFTATLSVSPFDYIIHKRLTKARSLIRSQHDLTQVALDTGFSSHSHMSMVFKKHIGVSPSVLRSS